jgi:hypothetical protein
VGRDSANWFVAEVRADQFREQRRSIEVYGEVSRGEAGYGLAAVPLDEKFYLENTGTLRNLGGALRNGSKQRDEGERAGSRKRSPWAFRAI